MSIKMKGRKGQNPMPFAQVNAKRQASVDKCLSNISEGQSVISFNTKWPGFERCEDTAKAAGYNFRNSSSHKNNTWVYMNL